MSEIDAVITNLEIQIESAFVPYGHYVSLRFIDVKPTFPKVQETIEEIKKNRDLFVVDYKYDFREIDNKTDLSYLKLTRH
tara:strand:- start:196 stop:435 length:240 start_codon:yes stop_codon:yes gene_type:complete